VKTTYQIKTDVAVIGGGPSGIAAAVSAARGGADTLLVEQYGFLGGLATTGLPLLSFHTMSGKQVFEGFAQEFVDELQAIGGAMGHIQSPPDGHAGTMTPVYPESVKLIAERIAQHAGVRLLLHAKVCDAKKNVDTVTSVLLATKEGLIELKARVYVDCTGDADLVAYAGGAYTVGRAGDAKCQTMTTLFSLGGVDVESVAHHFRNELYYAVRPGEDTSALIHLSGKLDQFHKEGTAEFPFSDDAHDMWAMSLRPGELNLNVTDLAGYDALTSSGLTEAELAGRQQVAKTHNFLRTCVPGFSRSYLSSTSYTVGVRESRRITGLTTLSANDVLLGRTSESVIARGGYCLDMHDPDGKGITFTFQQNPAATVDIPYGTLVPENLSNVIVAGRSLSASHEALAAVRLMAICMCLGEAAGWASAIACHSTSRGSNLSDASATHRKREQQLTASFHEVNIGDLQEKLRSTGVLLW